MYRTCGNSACVIIITRVPTYIYIPVIPITSYLPVHVCVCVIVYARYG